jgi:hypothetical protein
MLRDCVIFIGGVVIGAALLALAIVLREIRKMESKEKT